MKWKFWGRKAETKSNTLALGLSPELGSFLIFGVQGFVNPAEAMSLYRKSTVVSVPINYIGDAFSCLEPVLKQGDKKITNHPVLDLLRAPSPHFTKELFLQTLGKNYLIAGETGVVAIGNVRSSPVQLEPESPVDLTPVEGRGGHPRSWIVSGNGLVGEYVFSTTRNRGRYLNGTLLELRHIRNYSTRNGAKLRGESSLVAASAEARQHILGNTHNKSLLEKGGRVSLIFHFEEDMSPDDFEETKRKVREQYAGAEAAGTIGVTSGGKLNINEIGINNKDMDFANLQVLAKQAVAMQYKIPLPLITTDASSFNNYALAKLALYDDAVLPLADVIFGGLSELLLPRFGLDPAKFMISYDEDMIPAIRTRRNEELKLRKELNIESDNELRPLLGREPYEGGDAILKPANLIPAGVDLFTDDNDKGQMGLIRDR